MVPPLRERAEDILPLAGPSSRTLRGWARASTPAPPRHGGAPGYAWPGNVRELRNAIEHGAIITSGETLRLPLLDSDGPSSSPRTLSDVEREHILRVLARTGGRIKGPGGAAAELGLKPATLYSRMKKLVASRAMEPEDDISTHDPSFPVFCLLLSAAIASSGAGSWSATWCGFNIARCSTRAQAVAPTPRPGSATGWSSWCR